MEIGNISILFEGQEVIFSRNMTSDIFIVMELLEDHMPRCVNITTLCIEKWSMQNVFNMWVKGISDDKSNKSFLVENRFHPIIAALAAFLSGSYKNL